MADTLEIFGDEFTNVTGIKATDDNDNILTYIRPQGTKTISANGSGIDVMEYASVDVSVSTPTPTLQTKSVSYTPSETAQSGTVTADVGYDGLDEVNVSVGAISSTYVGTGITRRSSTDLTASGATVSVPSGFYENNASKAVASGSATPASSISGTSATVSTGTNTLTLSKTVSNTPQVTAGYVASGTAGNSSVSLTANVTTKGTATITPSTSNQTITSGTYLTGTQTISGDANLVAGNIKSGTTIFGVTGTYTGGGGGGSNFVQGTFTTPSTTGVSTFTIPYTGSGYPIALMIYIAGGPYNNGTGGNTNWYNLIQRYAVGVYTIIKAQTNTVPTYTSSGENNQGTTMYIHKGSASNATTYSRSSSMNTNSYSDSNATNAINVRFKGNGTTVSYNVGYYNTSTAYNYGLVANTEYAYIAVYSS